MNSPLSTLERLRGMKLPPPKDRAYPPVYFRMRILDEISLSTRVGYSLLLIQIPTQVYGSPEFAALDPQAHEAWRTAVDCVMNIQGHHVAYGLLKDNLGMGVLICDADPSLLLVLRGKMLRELARKGLLEKLRLRPSRPVFEVFFRQSGVESDRINAETLMQQFRIANEGFFRVHPLFTASVPTRAATSLVYRGGKRLMDICGAGMGLLVLSPLLLMVAAVIKITDPRGTVLFRQVRVGRFGTSFTMFKFRSMYSDAESRVAELMAQNEASGPVFKIRNDPRVTPVGRFIRRYSIDELPQLLNILRGEMSIVGPRPPIPSEVAQYQAWHRERLDVKPGLTCFWQVSGRSDIDFEDWMRLDHRYIRKPSLWSDIGLIVRTVGAVMRSRGAY